MILIQYTRFRWHLEEWYSLLKSHHTFTVWTYCPKKEWREHYKATWLAWLFAQPSPPYRSFIGWVKPEPQTRHWEVAILEVKREIILRSFWNTYSYFRNQIPFSFRCSNYILNFLSFFFSGSYPIYIHFFRVDKFAELALFG